MKWPLATRVSTRVRHANRMPRSQAFVTCAGTRSLSKTPPIDPNVPQQSPGGIAPGDDRAAGSRGPRVSELSKCTAGDDVRGDHPPPLPSGRYAAMPYNGKPMNPDALGKEQRPVELRQQEGVAPNVGHQVKAANVPVFTCLVYVSPDAGAGVRARVANLSGLECTAASEREALGKIVSVFKQRVSDLMHSEISIPWIEPPTPAEPGEQIRFIPVHL